MLSPKALSASGCLKESSRRALAPLCSGLRTALSAAPWAVCRDTGPGGHTHPGLFLSQPKRSSSSSGWEPNILLCYQHQNHKFLNSKNLGEKYQGGLEGKRRSRKHMCQNLSLIYMELESTWCVLLRTPQSSVHFQAGQKH